MLYFEYFYINLTIPPVKRFTGSYYRQAESFRNTEDRKNRIGKLSVAG
jgi:hypothetical protein